MIRPSSSASLTVWSRAATSRLDRMDLSARMTSNQNQELSRPNLEPGDRPASSDRHSGYSD
jgi:hypothetical protein